MIRDGGQAASPKVWASFIVTGDASPPLFEARPPSTTGAIVAAGIVLACVAAGVLMARRRRGVTSPDTEAAGR
jgi:hypothetical protein